MYNNSERSTNHIDVDSTMGNFKHLFDCNLYGYYVESICEHGFKKGYLRFTLFFANPFDPKISSHAPDQWPCKEELDGFKNISEIEQTIKRKNIKVVTLLYKDGCNYEEPSLLKKLLLGRSTYLPNINDLKDNSLLYKVSFDIPTDVIADYITVDKISMNDDGSFVKEINLYTPDKSKFLVETLFHKLNRVESLITEMQCIISEITKHPEIYKKRHDYQLTNTQFDGFWQDCHNSDEERRTVKGYNIENAEYLLNNAKKSFETMREVIYNARHLDIIAEPKESEFTKCSHDICKRPAEKNSRYCNKCIQLPTEKCNFCENE